MPLWPAPAWSAFGRDGIEFTPAKTSKTTGGRVLIEWTPKLRDVDRRLKELRVARRAFGDYVFTKQAAKKGMAKAGKRYTYWGASTAWRRACERAGIKDLHFHDLRAKALTDTEESDGMQAANSSSDEAPRFERLSTKKAPVSCSLTYSATDFM